MKNAEGEKGNANRNLVPPDIRTGTGVPVLRTEVLDVCCVGAELQERRRVDCRRGDHVSDVSKTKSRLISHYAYLHYPSRFRAFAGRFFGARYGIEF